MNARSEITCALLATLVFISLPGASATADEDTTAFAMPLETFRQLSEDDQRAIVIEAIEHRLQHAGNLFYESRRTLRNHLDQDGVPGDVTYEGYTFVHRRWRLGDSYRLDTDNYGRDPEIRRYHVAGYDADAGVSRATRQTVGNKRSYGRIDVTHNEMSAHDRYGYWLDGEHTVHGEFIFRYLLDHQGEISVEVPADATFVKVSVPWQPHFSDEALGTREFMMDPQRGFFPIRGLGYWERTRPDGTLSWRREEFFAEEPVLVGDVWMPTRLREVIDASSGNPDDVSVYEAEILAIEHGSVTPEDLVVPFKEGMEVVDAIQGITYVADADGNPQVGTSEVLFGAESYAAHARTEPVPSGTGTWLILLNAGVMLIAVCVFLKLRGRTSPLK